MLTLLYARAGQEIRRELLERLGQSTAVRKLLLVPEQYSHESERSMCQVLGNCASRSCEVLSFTRLAGRLREVAGGGAIPVLDGGGRMLLMYTALRQCADQLRVYRSPSRKPSFLSHVLATIDECKSCCVQPRQLIEAGEELGGQQGDKWRDIGLLYSTYETLAAQGAADPRSRLDVLTQQLGETRWGEDKEFAVFGFTDFTPQEEQVLEKLISQTHVTVALVCDPSYDPEGIFEPALRAASRLKRLARQGGGQVVEEHLRRPQPTHPALRWMEEHLYGPLPQPWEGECPVTLAQAATPRQEVEWAASQIVTLLRTGGVRCRDIVVCSRRMEEYGELVESIFDQYGIPVFLSSMEDILRHPVLALVTSALATVAQNYPYEELFHYLKTDLTGLTQEERDLLENYVITWNIKGSMWTRQKPWTMHPQGYGLTFRPWDEDLINRINEIRQRVIAPLERMRKQPDHTGEGRAKALYQMLEEIDLPGRLEERAASLEQRGDLNTAARYRQLWDIVVGGLEQCALLLGETEMELEEFSRLFALVLSQYDVGTIPVSLDRVTLGESPRMAHKDTKVLFLLGADSTTIPSCSPAAGLFSDQDRDALAAMEVELAGRQEEQLRRELTIVYETCARPTQELYISYASQHAGDERVGSFLWERLEQLFPQVRRGDPGALACRLAAPGPAIEVAGEEPRVRKVLAQFPEMAHRIERLSDVKQWRRGRLSPQAVAQLYGGIVPMSATRLDLYQSCHFAHFLRFGLRAQPRKQAKFQATDYGTFVHAVLEKVLEQHPAPEQCRAVAQQEADRYQQEVLGGLEDESARMRWLFGWMKRSVLEVVDSIAGEMAVSHFAPSYLELGFGDGELLPPVEVKEDGVTLRLTGYVDRVDSWLHEGKRYLRVVDYKTGVKDFDFAELEDGRGLQMLLYLFALSNSQKEIFSSNEELVPAGVLYVPARTVVVDGTRHTTQKDIQKGQDEKLRRQGLVLDHAEVIDAMEQSDGGEYRYLPLGPRKRDSLVSQTQMEQLDDYIIQVLHQTAREVARGNIDADPYWRSNDHNACRWCEFRSACHFEKGQGDRIRRRKAKRALEFWKWMEERLRGEKDGN